MLVSQEHVSKLITMKPTVENCDPVTQYQNSTPIDDFNLLEITPILYGGGRKWQLNSVYDPLLNYNTNPLKYIVLAHQRSVEVDLFALNTSFIIWFNDYSKGIELHYRCLGSHSVKKNEQGALFLSLKVKNNGVFYNNDDYQARPDYIEFAFTPIYAEYERYYNDEVEKLFTYEFFGVNKGDKMVLNTFGAIAKCSSFYHGDEQDIDWEGQAQVGTNINYGDKGYINEGNADDMDYNYNEQDENEYGAGIDVNITDDFKRGVVRRREEFHYNSSKKLRC